jgi:hypothetical protein
MKKITQLLFIIIVNVFISYAYANTDYNIKIFNVLSSLPRFMAQDLDEEQTERNIRLEKLSIAIDKGAAKYKPNGVSKKIMASALMTGAYIETRLAKNVSIGRCDLMPKGQRCDGGKAKTYFQLWEVACPAVWASSLEPGSQEELDIAAECAAKLLTAAYNRCYNKNDLGIWAGAFTGYRSSDCNWVPKIKEQSPEFRQTFMNTLYYKLTTN